MTAVKAAFIKKFALNTFVRRLSRSVDPLGALRYV
jgi:hypothetical protein